MMTAEVVWTRGSPQFGALCAKYSVDLDDLSKAIAIWAVENLSEKVEELNPIGLTETGIVLVHPTSEGPCVHCLEWVEVIRLLGRHAAPTRLQ